VEVTVDTVRRGYAALNRGDLSEVLDRVDDDIVWESGTGDEGRGPGVLRAVPAVGAPT